jgi:hypothetical protein
MTFFAPLWLVGLLPWAVVTVWLLTGRREGTAVPFLNLWRGPEAALPRTKASMQVPPLAVVCAMLAMLLAILGAARPGWILSESKDRPLTTAPSTQKATIVYAAAARLPHAQVLVRIRNDSDQAEATLKVATVQSTIGLPPRGQEQNYFVDLDRLEKSTPIELDATHRGTLVDELAWPSFETRGQLPAEVTRMIDVYSKLRPTSPDSIRAVVTSVSVKTDEPGVIVASLDDSKTASGPIKAAPHPITANVDWSAASRQELRVVPQPGSGWQTIVKTDQHDLVAVRQSPARQVWVGFTSESWPRSSDFVIFWTNVLDWVGQGGEAFRFVSAQATPTSTASANPGKPAAPVDLSPGFLSAATLSIFAAFALWATCKNCAAR